MSRVWKHTTKFQPRYNELHDSVAHSDCDLWMSGHAILSSRCHIFVLAGSLCLPLRPAYEFQKGQKGHKHVKWQVITWDLIQTSTVL